MLRHVSESSRERAFPSLRSRDADGEVCNATKKIARSRSRPRPASSVARASRAPTRPVSRRARRRAHRSLAPRATSALRSASPATRPSSFARARAVGRTHRARGGHRPRQPARAVNRRARGGVSLARGGRSVTRGCSSTPETLPEIRGARGASPERSQRSRRARGGPLARALVG